MKLIIGLGNPGKKYIKTRHNIGFRVADGLIKKLGSENCRRRAKATMATARKLKSKLKALISEGIFNNEKILLAKPQTFMNLSGQAVKILSTYYKINPQNIWVIHDDIDLPLGRFKISQNISSAGHKGVQSIIDNLGTKDFVRFRIGIKQIANRKSQIAKLSILRSSATAEDGQLKTKNLEKFVLEKFSKDEEEIVKQIIKKTTNALLVALEDGIEKAMNEYNC